MRKSKKIKKFREKVTSPSAFVKGGCGGVKYENI